MEKGYGEKPVRIVITGPESTGKTNISDYLAKKFDATWIPEYARFYMYSLRNQYDYSDIVKIAKKQIEDYHKYSDKGSGLIIFDTWLIITKIWFEEVFHKFPDWLDSSIETLKIDFYLICKPDIPWEPDMVRENGGDKREYLFDRYKEEIKKLEIPYNIISGDGEKRYEAAETAVKEFINGRV